MEVEAMAEATLFPWQHNYFILFIYVFSAYDSIYSTSVANWPKVLATQQFVVLRASV